VAKAIAKEAGDRFASMDALVAELEAIAGIDPDRDPTRSRRQRRMIAAVVTVFAVISGVVAGARTGWGATFSLRYVFIQSMLGIPAFGIATFFVRKSLLRDAYGRRLMLVYFVVLFAINAHRGLAFFSDTSLLAVLRGDAVTVAAIAILGGVLLERWLLASAGLMAAFLVVSLLVPWLSVMAFGIAIIGTVALAVWVWREPETR
jgi:hypothetical protein